ncbi:TlpA family protein disulfide reductase [Iamia sp. SCSIO 61187]|uniref:TlpA family protein disulfide reductase n=1 Tax=Iamia sp. SCSIO 61187 TaxID=2722752 RepID=UPI001C62AE98|nr:TlpA disulfide reductase family protein [Iamia sp. SCSIO 61187]QYG94356.1 TlpA family protein disulfide reductase [Iamia sp. SCSIO 61187]
MADGDDSPDPEDDAPNDEARDDATDHPRATPPRRTLDGRTLATCAVIALVAALVAGFVASRLTDDDGDEGEPGPGELTLAEDAPDLALPRLGSDEEVRLTDYRGQPLVVNFWGSWCVPCVEEMPDLERVFQSVGDQVAFLGVNVNDSVEAATRMVARTGVTYDLAQDVDGALGRALEVTTFPTTFLIDADGTIVDVSRREISAERLCEKINQSLLNQSLEECG